MNPFNYRWKNLRGLANLGSLGIMLVIVIWAWAMPSFAGSDLANVLGITQPKVRMQAPYFSLQSTSGQWVSLHEFQDKAIILNFWSVEFPPCLKEMPALQKLWEQHRDQGLVVIGIAVDSNTDKVRQWVQRLNIAFPTLLDPNRQAREAYDIQALPTTYLIARDGKFSGRILGERDWQNPQMLMIIRQLIVENKNHINRAHFYFPAYFTPEE